MAPEQRKRSKTAVLRGSHVWAARRFDKQAGRIFIVNETKVLCARVRVRIQGSAITVALHVPPSNPIGFKK